MLDKKSNRFLFTQKHLNDNNCIVNYRISSKITEDKINNHILKEKYKNYEKPDYSLPPVLDFRKFSNRTKIL